MALAIALALQPGGMRQQRLPAPHTMMVSSLHFPPSCSPRSPALPRRPPHRQVCVPVAPPAPRPPPAPPPPVPSPFPSSSPSPSPACPVDRWSAALSSPPCMAPGPGDGGGGGRCASSWYGQRECTAVARWGAAATLPSRARAPGALVGGRDRGGGRASPRPRSDARYGMAGEESSVPGREVWVWCGLGRGAGKLPPRSFPLPSKREEEGDLGPTDRVEGGASGRGAVRERARVWPSAVQPHSRVCCRVVPVARAAAATLPSGVWQPLGMK